MSIPRLLVEGEKAWWQFWKKDEPEPVVETVTILGMEPLSALVGLVIIVAIGTTIYHHPNWFFRGLAESVGWVAGLLAVGVVVGGAVGLYTMSLGIGIAAFVVYLVFVAFIIFAANGL